MPPKALRQPGPRQLTACVLCLAALLVSLACPRQDTHDGEPLFDSAGPRARPDPQGPNGTTTGVPAGTTLAPSKSLDVWDDGTVVSGLAVDGTIHVHADNVTILDTRVTSSDYWPIWLDPGNRALTVIDTEVVGSGSCQAGIGTHDYRAIRVNVHGCGDGAKAGESTTIEDSWFHDLRVTPGSHNDGIQVSDGDHIVIRRNRISAPAGQTSAIMIGPDYGTPISHVTIEGNWLDGGAYAVHLEADDATVAHNRFGHASRYGPANLVTAPSVWKGNVWADTGEPVKP